MVASLMPVAPVVNSSSSSAAMVRVSASKPVGRGVERGLVGGDAQARARCPCRPGRLMPSRVAHRSGKVSSVPPRSNRPDARPARRRAASAWRPVARLAAVHSLRASVSRQRAASASRSSGMASATARADWRCACAAQFGVQLRVRARQPHLALAAQFGNRLVQPAARACARLRQRAARFLAPRRR